MLTSATRDDLCDVVVVSWRTSSRSTNNGAQCVEAGAAWRKSSRSNDNGAQCVEVGSLLDNSGLVAVRDSTDREGPALLNSTSDWNALLSTLRVS